jgi:L-threonylcarbamoyladenylate synthase
MQCPINPQLHQIKMPSNAAAYAHDLYAVLREQDARQLKHIFIEAVPETAEWDAIRDRLSKASGRV